jgi:hypothetical protein
MTSCRAATSVKFDLRIFSDHYRVDHNRGDSRADMADDARSLEAVMSIHPISFIAHPDTSVAVLKRACIKGIHSA